ncbi:MAG: carboxylesterase/lipase family protein, partial [Bdellovibrionales bacterium]
MKFILFLVLSVTIQTHAGFFESFGSAPQVETVQGVVEGRYARSQTLQLESDVAEFLGIRFAQAPIGSLRWQPPQPLNKFTGVYKAHQKGSEPLQPNILTGGITGSEDCLFLNIWVPKTKRRSPLPVMFWIHGGAFVIGSGHQKVALVDLYDGKQLAKQGDVIVVSANYRLGPLGFFAHPEMSIDGKAPAAVNFGLMDQIAALEWVKHNISRFGGDPQKVTVFGESAGGTSILSLIASPKAKNLFSRAIVQSGPDYGMPMQKALEQGNRISEHLGTSEKPLTLKQLKNVPGEELIRELPMLVKYGEKRFTFGPIVGDSLLPQPVLQTILKNQHNAVPLIIGTNAEEMRVLSPVFLRGFPDNLSDSAYSEFVRDFIGVPFDEAARNQYTKEKYGTNRKAMEALVEDGLFHSYAGHVARAMARSQNSVATYQYLFTQKAPLIGAGHALDLGYTFQNKALLLMTNNEWYNPFHSVQNFNKQMKLSSAMIKMWSNFSDTGNPNTRDGQALKIPWHQAHQGNILELNTEGMKMRKAPEGKKLAYWSGLISRHIESTGGPVSCRRTLTRR